ncbi:hypothetical protein L7F22_050163 [Adiantum nelumboides]|nr:hypothetical protein [Adiantum nelumboides]
MTHINPDEHQARRPVLTPKRAIEAHSLGGLATNPSGTHAIVGVKRYSFEKKETEKKLLLIEIPSGSSVKTYSPTDESNHAILTTKANGDLTCVTEHEQSEEVKEWDDVKVYDSLMIRHWDTWLYPGKRSQLFSVDLTRHGGSNGAHWSLSDTLHKPHWSFASPFRNLLNNTKQESPVAPFGDASDYAVSETHVAFTARDPDVSAAITTKHNIYIVPLDGSEPPKVINAGDHGASSSPDFSPKGNHLVWLQMYDKRYEADRNRITVAHVSTGTIATILPDWQLSPGTIKFSRDGKSLVGTVENQAQKRLFTVELHRGGGEDGDKLTNIDNHEVAWQTEEGAVGSVARTAHADEWLVSASTLRGPAEVYLLSQKIQNQANLLQSRALPLTKFGQSKSSSLLNVDFGTEAEHFTYSGANGRDAYAWLVKPPVTMKMLKLVFAAQGFVVVAFNPAGSTGYGQAYQEEILGQLGGSPLQDIQLGTKYVLDKVSTLDKSRVVAAGASYGGFMMNWIQGHNEDKLFKGLVCHDGIFSIQGMYYATEELYFPEHEAGGPLYDPSVREKFLQWSPERFADKWETPMLVIHGGKDYRLTDSEGISAFTLLQRRGIDSRFVYFPKENHWVINPKNSLKWHQEVLGWLKKYSKTGTDELRHTVQQICVLVYSLLSLKELMIVHHQVFGGERLPFGTICGEFKTPASGWVHGVAFSPSGDSLAFVGHDSSLTVAYPSGPDQPPHAIHVLRSPTLPYIALQWVAEGSLVAAGHDCQPVLFTGDVTNGWKLAKSLDAGGAVAGKAAPPPPPPKPAGVNSGASSVGKLKSEAFNTFRSADSRGSSTSVSALNSAATDSPANVTAISTSGVDGRLCIFNVNAGTSAMNALQKGVASIRVA